MPPHRKTLGVDARCSVLLGYLRPSTSIDQRFPNKVAGQRLCDLVAVCMGKVTRNGTKFLACFFKSESFPGLELYSAKRYGKVVEEGPFDLFFDIPPPPHATPQGEVPQRTMTTPTLTFIERGYGRRHKNCALVQGLAVDDDKNCVGTGACC